MKLKDLRSLLETKYPLSLQEEWDHSGMQIGHMNKEVTSVLVTLDITREVVMEAIQTGADTIISHHPLFFRPIAEIDLESADGQMIAHLLEHHINVLSYHTNFDQAKDGMNEQLASKLGLTNLHKLESDPYMVIGSIASTNISNYIEIVKDTFNLDGARYAGFEQAIISKVAIVGGSGADYTRIDAIKEVEDIDLFITGDTKSYHARYATEHGVNLLDVCHNIESIFIDTIVTDLNEKITVTGSQIDTSAFKHV